MTLLLLQIIDNNQKNFEIVRSAIYCLRCIAAEGKTIRDKRASRKLVAEIISKPQLRSLKALMDQIMQQRKIPS